MRPIVVFATALVFAGCGTKKCKDHTVLVTVDFDHATPGDVNLALSITVGSKAAQNPAGITVPAGKTSTTVEVDFSDAYPAGSAIEVSAVVSDNGSVLGSGDVKGTLGSSCGDLTVPVTLTQSGDHGVDADGGADAGEDMSHHDGLTTSPDMTTCPILYVSQMKGSDTANDGCTIAKPLATINHALSVRVGQKVEVCAGNYNERVTLTSGELLGGFNCSDFSRTNYGYPSFAANVTNIDGNNMDSATITIPATAAAGTTFDGFSVSGFVGLQGDPMNASIGVEVDGPATVSNNNITGGYAYATADNGSLGIGVTGAAEIFNNRVSGGTGVSTSATGSIGLFSNPTGVPPHIHDNTIHGGSGSGPLVGSLGMVIAGNGNQTAAQGNGVEKNIIDGGTGTSTGTAPQIDVIALWLQDSTTVDVFGNTITGNQGKTSTYDVDAIHMSSEGMLHVYDNRIYSGSGNGTNAIVADGAGKFVIESNMVLAGTVAGGGWSTDLEIAASNVTIIHNTIIAGSDTSGGYHPLIHVLAATPPFTKIDVENNILAGSGGNETTAIQGYDICVLDALSGFRNNVTMYTDNIAWTGTNAGTSCASLSQSTYTDDKSFQAAFSAVASGNIFLNATCISSLNNGCTVLAGCDSAADCLSALFPTWNASDEGFTTLTSVGAFSLNAKTPCLVAKSAVSTQPLFNADFAGTPWPASPTMGASEQLLCTGM